MFVDPQAKDTTYKCRSILGNNVKIVLETVCKVVI
jgi:hypothetical protein